MSAHSVAAKKIAQRHHNGYNAAERAHPLDGMSTAEFVRVARAGWPKVPVPGDPFKAAQRVVQKHQGDDVLSLIKYEEV